MQQVMPMYIRVVLMIAAVITALPASAAQWHNLGSRTVTRQAETDRIIVHKRDQFRQIKLAVAGTGVRVHRMRVEFRNGQKHDFHVARFIPANGQSRLIDLPGDERAIKTISFYYDAQGLKGRMAVVSVWGKH